ncbi:unnamed protein product [Arctogadus glacialis]
MRAPTHRSAHPRYDPPGNRSSPVAPASPDTGSSRSRAPFLPGATGTTVRGPRPGGPPKRRHASAPKSASTPR